MTTPFIPIAEWFEALTADTLSGIDQIYANDAHFKDPFHDVQGRDRILAIYAKMFKALQSPQFHVQAPLGNEHEAFLRWTMTFRLRGQDYAIVGTSYLRLDASGRIIDHVDYWDAAEYVYEKIPLLGGLIRLVKQKLAH